MALLGAGGCSGQDAKSDAADLETELLLGQVTITPDATSVILASSSGAVGSWDTHSARVFYQQTRLEGICALRRIPGDRRYLILRNRHNREAATVHDRHHREVALMDPRTMKVQKRFKTPAGPPVVCCVSSTVIALLCSDNPGEPKLRNRLVFWRLENNNLNQISTFRHPQGECSIADVRRISDDVVFVHFALSGNDQKVGLRTSEVATFDVSRGRLLRHARSSASAKGMLTGRVAHSGGYAVVFSDEVIELYQLPSLVLLKKLRLDDRFAFPDAVALSDDGRYVAFGSARLDVWDTQVHKSYLLDSLSQHIVNSPDFALRGKDDPLSRSTAIQQYCLGALEFMKDSNQLAALTRDGVYIVFDVSTRKRLRTTRLSGVHHLGGIPAEKGE